MCYFILVSFLCNIQVIEGLPQSYVNASADLVILNNYIVYEMNHTLILLNSLTILNSYIKLTINVSNVLGILNNYTKSYQSHINTKFYS